MKAKKRGAARGAVARLQATRALPLECRLERKAWRRARDKAVRGGLPAPAVVRGSALGDGEAAVFLSSALPGDPQAGAELLEGAAESFWRRSWQGDLRDDVQGNVQSNVQSDVQGDVKSDLQRDTNYLAQGAHQGHDFRWLLDLRTLGGQAARQRAVAQVRAWLESPTTPPLAWQPEVVAARLANLSLAWSFFATPADSSFRRRLAESQTRQAVWLAHLGTGGLLGTKAVGVSAGCLLAFLTHGRRDALYDTTWRRLFTTLNATLLADGGTIERSPALQYELLVQLATLHAAACRAEELAIAERLKEPLSGLARTLALYRHEDGGLALFHGSTESGTAPPRHTYAPDLLLAGKRVARWGRLAEARETGFMALTCGHTRVILDCATAAPPRGADGEFHLAAGAIEVSLGKERIFGNCGTAAEPEWRQALRRTAAHSLLSLDGEDCGSFAASETWLGRGVDLTLGTTRLQVHDSQGALSLVYSHQGWRTWQASRALRLSHDGRRLEGCETLTPLGSGGKRRFALRFHLARGLPVVFSRDGASLLVRLAEGGLWRLRVERGGSGKIRLEDGVLSRGGLPQRSRVAVIDGETETRGAEVAWSLARA